MDKQAYKAESRRHRIAIGLIRATARLHNLALDKADSEAIARAAVQWRDLYTDDPRYMLRTERRFQRYLDRVRESQ